MNSIASIFTFASLAALALTTPIENLKKRSTGRFSINQVQVGTKPRDGVLALQRAYQKYNIPYPSLFAFPTPAGPSTLPSSTSSTQSGASSTQSGTSTTQSSTSTTQSSTSATQTGSVVTNPEAFDVRYLCPVSVGGTTMFLDFDTGSADL
jgi:hypothetical protein